MFVLLAALILFSNCLNAASFSFEGALRQDDEVRLFTLTLAAPAWVTARTWSYAGGINAAGHPVARGGFDPILALFASDGTLLVRNDDGQGVERDLSGTTFDALLLTYLEPGSYILSLMQYDNAPRGPNLANGFVRQGQGDYTGNDVFFPGCSATPRFCDVSGSPQFRIRNSHFALDILNVDGAVEGAVAAPIPELGPMTMVCAGLIGFVAVRYRRSR